MPKKIPLRRVPYQDEDAEVILSLTYFAMYGGWLSVKRPTDIRERGYMLVNNHTGVVEAEGNNYANTLVGLYYLEQEYIRIVANPEREMKIRQERANSVPDFSRMFAGDEPDPTVN